MMTKIEPRKSEFFLPRAFQRWSRNFRKPSVLLENYFPLARFDVQSSCTQKVLYVAENQIKLWFQ